MALAACGSSNRSNPTEPNGSATIAPDKPAPVALNGTPAPVTPMPAGRASILEKPLSATVIRDVFPWSFRGEAGQSVVTANFVIRTTETSPMIAQRMPGFLEAALTHYQSALVPLPMPTRPIEVYVMNTRAQWQELTLDLLGEKGAPVTQIRRGGFTTRGKSLLFDIGASDTLAIAAHECWHAYTQTTFAEAMPLWLEEGLATYMEGHRWRSPTVATAPSALLNGSAEFLPWANMPRFDRLRQAANSNELMSLETLLKSSPNQMIGVSETFAPASDAPVVWYSQVWALVHFLNEGEGGKYRDGLRRIIDDASRGRLRAAMQSNVPGKPLAAIDPVRLFRVYLSDNLGAVNAEYRLFVRRIVASGGREAAGSGRSPIGATR